VIAALFVHHDGCYAGLAGVDAWPESRDARLYSGPHPVVAHPPCTRWCQLAGLVQHRWGHKVGEDGGCFASALASVRKWGGVLEHPAYTKAWPAYGLPTPPRAGGWLRTPCGGWVAHVEQLRYGHPARKATWLYAHGVESLPELRWGVSPAGAARAIVSRNTNHLRADDTRPRIDKKNAAATPPAFRDVLLSIARSVRVPAEVA